MNKFLQGIVIRKHMKHLVMDIFVEYDAEIVLVQCGKCADPLPENDDKIMYNVNQIENYRPHSIVLVQNK